MRFPKAVAAHRWQSWLLVTALLSVLVTGLLVWDLTRNLKTVIISETNQSLANAVKELSQETRQAGVSSDSLKRSWDDLDRDLKKISYETLRFYFDVEGGYLLDDEVIGHSFPTYTEPGSALKQPPLEHAEVLAALQESRKTGGIAERVKPDGRDLVIVSVLAHPNSRIAAWGLRRILNFSDTGELRKRYLLVAAMIISLISIATVLRLSFSLQRGFRVIRSGLRQLETDPAYRIPDQNHELASFVQAINSMAENRQRLEAELRREDRLRSMGRVVAGIAHEIRNPLNSIRLTARVLTTKPGGTGLGLAVTKTVLEKMGATIRASNHAKGARFTIHLPIEAAS